MAVLRKKIYSKSNLGLREKIVTGINEIFACEEAGIFLEEDCYPDPTFFEFSQENLAHWKNHPQVAVISGSSFAKEKKISWVTATTFPSIPIVGVGPPGKGHGSITILARCFWTLT